MKRGFCFALFLIFSVFTQAQITQNFTDKKTDDKFFIENKGQWQDDVLFLARFDGLDFWITTWGMRLHYYDVIFDEIITLTPDALENLKINPQKPQVTSHVVDIIFEGSTSKHSCEGLNRLKGYYNYFIGSDSSKWATNVGLYSDVIIREIYPGIDVKYSFDAGNVRFDFIVNPGADFSQISMKIKGAYGSRILHDREIAFATRYGDVILQDLKVFQNNAELESKFVHQNGLWKFDIKHHDASQPMIIDPVIYSTFLGGTNGDEGYSVSLDAGNNIYVTGFAFSSNFPVTPGAYDNTHNGSHDVFVSKISSDGTTLIFSTFIGGFSWDYGYSLALDASNNVYVTGYTESGNYPTTGSAYDNTHNGNHDVFVTKLNSAGNALLFSTFLGGTGWDYGYSLALDNSFNAYVTGYTYSSDFPTTSGAFDISYNGGIDAFVAKLSSNGSNLLYSTFLGGSDDDRGFGIDVDASNNAYVTGYTKSTDFSLVPGSFDLSHNGNMDVFITKINSSGANLMFSTFVGGVGEDVGKSIAVDASGNSFVTGYTYSNNLPASPVFDDTHNGDRDAFVLQLNAAGNILVYCTYLGGSGFDEGNHVVIGSGSAYVVGTTWSNNFPVTAGAYDVTQNGGYDVFFTKFTPMGDQLMYSTFVGGTNFDYGQSIFIEPGGAVLLVGYTLSGDFPTSSNAFDNTFNGGTDVFVFKLTDVILPLELVRFEGMALEMGRNHLFWETSYEENTDYFLIERKNDAGEFVPIGTVNAAGSSNQIKMYDFVDFEAPSIAYYRLSGVDYDGKITSYAITLVENKNSLADDELYFYPNPVTDYLNLILPAEEISLTVYDITGQIIVSENFIPVGNRFRIPLSHLAPGTYIGVIDTDKGEVPSKFIFQKQ